LSGTDPGAGAEPLAAAMARHRAGELQSAVRLYREHLAAKPDDVGAWCLLAGAEGQGGNHAGARQAYERAATIAPEHAPAHAGLGTSSLHHGDLEAAAGHFRRALELDPDLHEARFQLATALRGLARLSEASGELKNLLERQPDHAQARFNLGMALLEERRPTEAEAEFRRVLAGRPGLVPALVGVARALEAQNRLAEARDAIEQARRAAPRDPAVLVTAGGLNVATGRLAEGRADYELALAADPRHHGAVLGLATLDGLEGDPQRGLERLELLPGRPPGGVLVLRARLLRQSGRGEEAERLTGTLLADHRQLPRVRAALLRELGMVRDERGDTEGAWAAWTQAHGEDAGRFDPGQFDRVVDALIEAFPPSVLEGRAAPADGPLPLLLVGAPRSGKSMLEQMLSCHPAIHGAGELRVVEGLVRSVERRAGATGYPACVAGLGPEDVAALATQYRAAVTAAGARWVTDTQPTNYLNVGLAGLLCPGLRVVYCRRDPADLAWACYSRGFAGSAFEFAASPAGIGRYLASLERLIAHWRRLLPGAVTVVDYERLVTEPEACLRDVLGFLGLPWDSACSEYHLPGRPSLSAPPVLTRPVDRREVGRGRPYANHFPDLPATGRVGECD
jgi:tetratricopeptide (TPR) repeat protein